MRSKINLHRYSVKNQRISGNMVIVLALVLIMMLYSIIMPAPSRNSASALDIAKGRLLASNCMQCHGTDGQSGAISQLAGMGATDLFNKMKDQQTHNSIMGSQARGYTDAEIRDLAAYFSTVPKL